MCGMSSWVVWWSKKDAIQSVMFCSWSQCFEFPSVLSHGSLLEWRLVCETFCSPEVLSEDQTFWTIKKQSQKADFTPGFYAARCGHEPVAASRMSSLLMPWCTICYHCIRSWSQTAWRHLANTLEIYDYLLQHNTDVGVASAISNGAHCGKTWRHPQNQKYIMYFFVVRSGPSHSPG